MVFGINFQHSNGMHCIWPLLPTLGVIVGDSKAFSMVWMHQHSSNSNCCIFISASEFVLFDVPLAAALVDGVAIGGLVGAGDEYVLFMFFNLPVLLCKRALGGGILSFLFWWNERNESNADSPMAALTLCFWGYVIELLQMSCQLARYARLCVRACVYAAVWILELYPNGVFRSNYSFGKNKIRFLFRWMNLLFQIHTSHVFLSTKTGLRIIGRMPTIYRSLLSSSHTKCVILQRQRPKSVRTNRKIEIANMFDFLKTFSIFVMLKFKW